MTEVICVDVDGCAWVRVVEEGMAESARFVVG